MALSRANIKELILLGGRKKYRFTNKDILFVILARAIGNKDIAYEGLFGDECGNKKYYSSPSLEYIENNIDKYLKDEDADNGTGSQPKDDITFEENKAYMLELKRRTERAMEKGEIAKKDGLKILSDLSVKLNDKFNVADDTHDTTVIVEQKYNDVCEYCGHEVAAKELTKEEAMKKFNLIENI